MLVGVSLNESASKLILRNIQDEVGVLLSGYSDAVPWWFSVHMPPYRLC